MIADCHVHTVFSPDSDAKITRQIERAIALGMKHICITDHKELDYPEEGFVLEDDRYVETVQQMQERYREQISIGLGVEIGMQEHLQEQMQQFIDRYPFDFVIGSKHLVQGEDPYFRKIFERLGDEEAYREYFGELLAVLKKAPKIQALGHLDYVVRYGKEKEKEYSYQKFQDEIDTILRFLIDRGIALEVNTAGMRVLSFTNPHPDVIRRYRELGGEMITIGSDSHSSQYLGYGFEKMPEYLKSCGFKYYAVFEQKIPKFIKL